jgi:diadenosine tetraphosphate (Ap4A) HIT family hydrolase
MSTSSSVDGCLLCRPEAADAHFGRARLWEDDLWRLSAVLHGPIPGFAHLEPHRHIPFIADLDGSEAATLGPVLARVAAVLRDAAGAEKTYLYVFGDHTPHFHVNLAPHRPGDALVGGPGLLAQDAVEADPEAHEAVAATARAALMGFRC